jgi:glucose/arabinose dehydrogenase
MTRDLRRAALIIAVTACAPSWADILVSSSGNDSILRYSGTTGGFLGALVPGGSGGLDDPRGLAVGPGNLLYVASRGTDAILRYNAATGAFIDTFVSSGLDSITDLGIGPDGNLYVLSGGFAGEVLRFDTATGALIDSFASPLAVFNTPIYLDFGFGELGVSTDTSRLFRFDALTGAQLSSQIRDTIHGVAHGPDGNLYVKASDSANVIRRLAATGAIEDFIPPFGAPGSRDIAFGPDGNLYVLAHGIERYSGATGTFIDTLVSAGSGGLTDPRYFIFVQAVPEPAAGMLLATGLGVLILCRATRTRLR